MTRMGGLEICLFGLNKIADLCYVRRGLTPVNLAVNGIDCGMVQIADARLHEISDLSSKLFQTAIESTFLSQRTQN